MKDHSSCEKQFLEEKVEEEITKSLASFNCPNFTISGQNLAAEIENMFTNHANEFYKLPPAERIGHLYWWIRLFEFDEEILIIKLLKLLKELLEQEIENLDPSLVTRKYLKMPPPLVLPPAQTSIRKIHINWPVTDSILAIGSFLLNTKSRDAGPLISSDRETVAKMFCNTFENYKCKDYHFRTVYDKLGLVKGGDYFIEIVHRN